MEKKKRNKRGKKGEILVLEARGAAVERDNGLAAHIPNPRYMHSPQSKRQGKKGAAASAVRQDCVGVAHLPTL